MHKSSTLLNRVYCLVHQFKTNLVPVSEGAAITKIKIIQKYISIYRPLATGWTTGESKFYPQKPWNIFFFELSGLKLSGLTLLSAHHSIEWVTRAILLGVKPPKSESNLNMAPK